MLHVFSMNVVCVHFIIITTLFHLTAATGKLATNKSVSLYKLCNCDLSVNVTSLSKKSLGVKLIFVDLLLEPAACVPGFLQSLEKYEKKFGPPVGKQFFWSVCAEKENNFPDLIFWHTFS